MASPDERNCCAAAAPVIRARLHRSALPLRRPLRTPRGALAQREVRLLEIENADGVRGLGEASAVDWLAPATGDDGALAALVERISHDAPLPKSLLQWTLASDAPPALRCALQTALLDLEARQRGCSVAALLGAGSGAAVLPLSALLGDDTPEAMAREAAALAKLGLRCFKMKVGRRSLDDDLSRARALRGAIGAGAALRFDANGAWSLDEARPALDALAAFEPDFLEEPLRDASMLPRLAALHAASARVPVAVDESLCDMRGLDAAIERGGFEALVLKLERVGGPLPALRLGERASRAGLRVVFSDSIESRVGRAATVAVAAAVATRSAATVEPVGLGGLFLLDDGETPSPFVTTSAPGLGVEAAETAFA